MAFPRPSKCWSVTPTRRSSDQNTNNIPDGWEWNYFGNLDQPADGDYDGDGVSNGFE